MADEFQLGSGSWWDTSKNRFEGGTTPAASITTTLARFGWPTDMVDMKSRSSMDSRAAAGGSLVLHGGDQTSTGGGDGVIANQMVGLGLTSGSMDWNHALFRGEKAESSFRSMLEEGMSSNTSNFEQDSSLNDFKQINRGFSVDQQQFSQAISNDSPLTSQNLTTGYVGLLLSENQQQHGNDPINYPIYSSSGGYGPNAFLRQPALGSGSHLHFTNVNTPFWDASAPPAAMADARSSFFPADQIPGVPCFDENPKNISEVRDLMSTTTKKNSADQITSNKRPRNETPSPSPAFKVRKEKMGDRITALQQLVSPFGKTDTASVLSEANEYIKFLHEQVNALSGPYMKNGAPIQHQQQNSDKYKFETDGPCHDLRSRGLCLVPVSSTFPATHETTVDFWTPTFGGSFR